MEKWKELRDEIALIFDRVQEVKKTGVCEIYRSNEFQKIAAAYRSDHPLAPNVKILRCITTHFSSILRTV